MKTNFYNLKQTVLAATTLLLLCASPALLAQQRTTTGGGGGNRGGGFGGGFGGFGGFGGANSSSSSSYNNNGTVGTAVISVDPDTHNIVVIADEETSQQISNVIANLDAPISQVLIKVVFMEVMHNNASDIGIEGGATRNAYSSFLGNSVTGSVANVFGLSGVNSLTTNFNSSGGASSFLSPISGATGANGFYQITSSDFQATLRAIATAGKSQILSRPSVLARDGQLAKIVVGQEVPLPTSVSYSGGTAVSIPIVNITYTDVGIILDVTPFIGNNGLIQMIIQPQTSVVDPTLSQTIAPGVSAPYLDVRSADTVVVTPDAQPVVIGGLISNSKSSSESKVPLLGDIPWLGNLFKSTSKADSKTELLMFLTPHIVYAPSQLAAMSGSETRQSMLITNSVSEQELDRFLERIPVKRN
jgi:general secretion pathway protein D